MAISLDPTLVPVATDELRWALLARLGFSAADLHQPSCIFLADSELDGIDARRPELHSNCGMGRLLRLALGLLAETPLLARITTDADASEDDGTFEDILAAVLAHHRQSPKELPELPGRTAIRKLLEQVMDYNLQLLPQTLEVERGTEALPDIPIGSPEGVAFLARIKQRRQLERWRVALGRILCTA